jgi:hypothetical protein
MPDRMSEDLPILKRINVMVGITRSKVIVKTFFFQKNGVNNGNNITCNDLFPALLCLNMGDWSQHWDHKSIDLGTLGAPSQIRRRRILSSFGAIGGASWKSSFG